MRKREREKERKRDRMGGRQSALPTLVVIRRLQQQHDKTLNLNGWYFADLVQSTGLRRQHHFHVIYDRQNCICLLTFKS